MIISTPTDLPNFERLLGDGSSFGIHLQYKVQPSPDGLAQAFLIGEKFIDGDSCAMVLGDNIFYGSGLKKHLQMAADKTDHPKSNYCVTGLYFYDNRVVDFAKKVKPSARGELEITDLNKLYLEEGSLDVVTLGRGYAWLDTGTMDALADAGEFVRVIEEIAYRNGWIDKETLLKSAEVYGKSSYGKHLRQVADGKILY